MTYNENVQLNQVLTELVKSGRIEYFTSTKNDYFTITVNTTPKSYVCVHNGNFDDVLKAIVKGINDNCKLYK